MRYYLVCFLSVLLAGCATLFGNGQMGNGSPYTGYVAIDPISLPPDLFTKVQVTAASEVKAADPTLHGLIDNAARVSIQEVSNSGEVKYITSGVSKKDTYYHATVDFIKYYSSSIRLPVVTKRVTAAATTNDSKKENEVDVVLGVDVGVGLRADAYFYSNETGAKIADIINIGVSAQSNQISGTMAFQTMGLESKAISDALPIPSQLSSSTIQNALQTMATVKANIYDSGTHVAPQIVGIDIQSYPDGVDLGDVIKALHSRKDEVIRQVKQELDQRLKFFTVGQSVLQ